MKQPAWVMQAITVGKGYHVKSQSRLVHNFINLFSLSLIWGLFLFLFWLGVVLPSYFYLPLGILGFAFCFHCLNVLVSHEACHELFIRGASGKSTLFWNRIFGWSSSIPVGFNFQEYWFKGHNYHHQHPVVPEDPELCNPKMGKTLLVTVLKLLFLPGYIHFKGAIFGKGVDFDCPLGTELKVNISGTIYLFIFWISVIWISIVTDFFSVNAVVALFFAFEVSSILRLLVATLQHGGKCGAEKNPFFRTLTSFFPFHFIILPFNLNYHFEHHLCDFIPWYLLPKYHQEVKGIIPKELHPYFFLMQPFKQISGRREGIPVHLRYLLEV